ncbi:MAG TPA: hypothetical protein VGL66_15825 [Caulobacteraceae bacterium]|jgi:hypothetical protein
MPKPPAVPAPARHANGRFGAGNPGRPLGARNRVSQRVAIAILKDFEAHQGELIPRLRNFNMTLYLRLVSNLLPRSGDVGLADYDLSDGDLADKIEDLRLALDFVERGEGTLLDLEAVLVGEAEMVADPRP